MSQEFQLKDGQRVVFIGDSITDSGRREPMPPLGTGYVKYIRHLITASRPGMDLTIFNRGVGGHVAKQLLDRWEDDVIALKPDWVSVLIGINDCCRFTWNRDNDEVSPEGYETHLQTCLQRTADALPDTRLVVMEPFLISQDRSEDASRGMINRNLDAYRAAARELASKFSAILVPLHDVFADCLTTRSAGEYSHDAVHLTELGAVALAWAWLDRMGF